MTVGYTGSGAQNHNKILSTKKETLVGVTSQSWIAQKAHSGYAKISWGGFAGFHMYHYGTGVQVWRLAQAHVRLEYNWIGVQRHHRTLAWSVQLVVYL